MLAYWLSNWDKQSLTYLGHKITKNIIVIFAFPKLLFSGNYWFNNKIVLMFFYLFNNKVVVVRIIFQF